MEDFAFDETDCENLNQYFENPYSRSGDEKDKKDCSDKVFAGASKIEDMDNCSKQSLLDYIERNHLYQLNENPDSITKRGHLANIILDNKCHEDDVFGRTRAQLNKCPKSTLQKWIIRHLSHYSEQVVDSTKKELLDIIMDNRGDVELGGDYVRYSDIVDSVNIDDLFKSLKRDQVAAYVEDSLGCKKVKDGKKMVTIKGLSKSKLLDLVRAIKSGNRDYLKQHATCEEDVVGKQRIPDIKNVQLIPEDKEQLLLLREELTVLGQSLGFKEMILKALKMDRADPNRELNLDAPYIDYLVAVKEYQCKQIREQFKSILAQLTEAFENAKHAARFVYQCSKTTVQERIDLVTAKRVLQKQITSIKDQLKTMSCGEDIGSTCQYIREILSVSCDGETAHSRKPMEMLKALIEILNKLVFVLRTAANKLSGEKASQRENYKASVRNLLEYASKYQELKREAEGLRDQVRKLKRRKVNKSLHAGGRQYRDGNGELKVGENVFIIDTGSNLKNITADTADEYAKMGRTVFRGDGSVYEIVDEDAAERYTKGKTEPVPGEMLSAVNQRLDEILSKAANAFYETRQALGNFVDDEDIIDTLKMSEGHLKKMIQSKRYPARDYYDKGAYSGDKNMKDDNGNPTPWTTKTRRKNFYNNTIDDVINEYVDYSTGDIVNDIFEGDKLIGSLFLIKMLTEDMADYSTACRLEEAVFGEPHMIKPCTAGQAGGRVNFTVTLYKRDDYPIFSIYDPRRNSLWVLVSGLEEKISDEEMEKSKQQIKDYFNHRVSVVGDHMYRENDINRLLRRRRDSSKLIASGRDIKMDMTLIKLLCAHSDCPYEALYFTIVKLINPDKSLMDVLTTTQDAFYNTTKTIETIENFMTKFQSKITALKTKEKRRRNRKMRY